MPTRVSAVVLAYGKQPWLERCVHALLSSLGVDVDVILVDNGCTDGAVDRLKELEGVVTLRPAKNLGFAGGCNLGARQAEGEVIAFVNPDTLVDPSALARLSSVALRPDVGIASASLRLADDLSKINSSGNPIHFLGMSWAGGFGAPASSYIEERDIASATGAAMALRREIWERLGGFEERFFAYHEDADLSLRCHLAGLRVVYVPDAIVVHRYEFSRNPGKYYLLERNRLVSVLTLYERRTIAVLVPALFFFEFGVFLLAVRRGWWREKVRAWQWLFRNRAWLRERRYEVQESRIVPDRVIASRLTGRLDQDLEPLPRLVLPLDWLLGAYWSLARKALWQHTEKLT